MDYRLTPWALTWDEVDPSRHPFDVYAAEDIIRSLAPASAVPLRPAGGAGNRLVGNWAHDEGRPWADSMTLALIEQFGGWASGWRWAKDEGDFGGGPVSAWCCPSHSMTSTDETLARVAEALVEWHCWLEDLAERFDRYPMGGPSDIDQLAGELGAVDLVHYVVERTGAGDAWYQHCAQVLTWFLARWGIAPERAEEMVDEAIGGRFDSWVGPPETLVDEIAESLARHAVEEKGGPSPA